MSIESLQKANPHLSVRDIADPRLAKYARVLDPFPFSGLVDLADTITTIDSSANKYVPSLPEMEADPSFRLLAIHFGLSEIQVGYCNGPNTKLNAVEWHKSSEIDIAVTDLVLLLGKRSDIGTDGVYDSADMECFYVPKGSALELLPEVLHYAPCKANPEGFKSIIVLPKGTNEALPSTWNQGVATGAVKASVIDESRFLFMKNKWLIAHPERKPLIERGAFPGICGDNIEVFL
jgi:hypothetical protein